MRKKLNLFSGIISGISCEDFYQFPLFDGILIQDPSKAAVGAETKVFVHPIHFNDGTVSAVVRENPL